LSATTDHPSVQVLSDPKGGTDLAGQVRALSADDAATAIEQAPMTVALDALLHLNPAIVQEILGGLDSARLGALMAAAPPEVAAQWERNRHYPAGTVGQLMEPPLAVFSPDMSVSEAIDALRPLVRSTLITYVYVVDSGGKLTGLVTMRDLLFNEPGKRLADIMLRDLFVLSPELDTAAAMKLAVNRHYPQYPVTDSHGKLVGLVRGAALFELQAFEITAQAGSMVGVEKEERIATPLAQSFKFRHPWLLINLVTAFAAGGVVALFQGTLDKLVILATFLPVLAGQSGNTGCQALAVTVRGITLGEVEPGKGARLISKEAVLGFLNGGVTGLLCGLAMFLYAYSQHSEHAPMLGVAVALAMIGSCVISGISGTLVPIILKKLGADPATASSIIVTTATDVTSMGMLLGLAALLIH